MKNSFPLPGWFTLALLFAIGIILGLWGARHDNIAWSDALYLTMQMILANVSYPIPPVTENVNWQFQVARLLLPAVAAWTTIGFVARLAGQHLWFLSLRFPCYPYIVFLGAGRIGSAIASKLHQIHPQHKIIAVDLTTNREHARHLEQSCGASLIVGDATDIGLLRRLNLPKAKAIYIFAGDDQRDLEIAFEVVQMIPLDGPKPDINVDVDDKSLVRIANLREPLQAFQKENGKLRWFSSHTQAARTLFLKHPPTTIPSMSITANVHIGVVGFGEMAQELVLQAVRHCVYLNEQPLLISIFGDDPAAFESFLFRNPVLDHQKTDAAYGGLPRLAILKFYKIHPVSPAPVTVSEAVHLAPLSKVYVTGANDQACQTASFRFRQTMMAIKQTNVEIVCCLPGTHYINLQEIEAEKRHSKESLGFYENITLFHATSSFFGANEVSPGGDADRFGVWIDAAYRAIYKKGNEQLFAPIRTSDDPLVFGEVQRKARDVAKTAIDSSLSDAKAAWETALSEAFRSSSRQSGDHIFVKLRELGFSLTAGEGGISDALLEDLRCAIEANMDSLTRMEHRRFCAERLIDGWLYFSETKKHTALNETLLPFNLLSDIEKIKDEIIIRAIPVILSNTEIRSSYTLGKL